MSTLPTMTSSIPNWLSLEIAQRMEEKLSIVRLSPQHIFHSGCLQPKIIYRHFPNARNYSSDLSVQRSPLTNLISQILKRPTLKFVSLDDVVCQHAIDLVWSNLELQHHSSPEELIKAWERLLKPESLLMFSYLGPDTAKELRTMGCLDHALPSTWDMHDVGDALSQSGFAEPVMDMEYITLEYDNAELLFKDAVELGFGVSEQINGLGVDGFTNPLQLTLEVVYGHAWTPKQRLSRSTMGVATIDIDQIVRQKT